MHFKRAWKRICSGESVMTVLMDSAGLGLCHFRAHCAARNIWFMSGGRFGTPVTSLTIGDGARDAVRVLTGGSGSERDFESLMPHLRRAVEAVAPPGLLDKLHSLGLHPDSPQIHEHILCEVGKVFGEGRYSEFVCRPGYAELFRLALPFYMRCAGVVL